MHKRTLLALGAALAAIPVALKAAELWNKLPEEEIAKPDEAMSGAAADNLVSCPLKNKYLDFTEGEMNPHYMFELETPTGVREFQVTQAHYETYYIGDEVICTEENGKLIVV